MTQHVDGAALGDLALQSREELAARRAVLAECECLGRLRLRFQQERGELGQVDAVLAVVVLRPATDPAGAVGCRPLVRDASRYRARITWRAGKRRADQPLEAALA